MGWLNKIFKGSSHKISEGQYHGKPEDDIVWNDPSTSVVILMPELVYILSFLKFSFLVYL